MKQYLKKNWLSLALLVAAIGFAAWGAPGLPDKIPTHFNLQGQPDAFGSKTFSLIFLPAVNLALLILLPALINLSPTSYQMKNSREGLARINLAITFLICGLYVITLRNAAAPGTLSLNFALVISGFMILVGNYLSKVERNFFAGIRTPWSIASEKNWLATHRFSARLFVVLGVVAAVVSFLTGQMYWAIGAILAAAFLSVLYSFYFYFRFERLDEHHTF